MGHEGAVSAWLRATAIRFDEVDPDDVPDAQLEPLLAFIGDSRVVALGESMHRSHEFLAWRARLLRFLVERAGFSALVLESGFVEGLSVDGWVRTGEGSLREVLNEGVTYHFGKCQEALDLVVWMRDRALAGEPVRFYGMDVPDSAASALPAVQEVVRFLDRADPPYADHLRATLLPAFDHLPADRSGLARAATAIQSYLALPGDRRHAITAAINGMTERLRARATDYAAAGADPEHVAIAIRASELARSTDAFLAAMSEGPTRTWSPANIRDVAMADTVEWILHREERVLLFAANGHVRRTPYLAPPFVSDPLATVGTHLAARLGDDLRVIGTTFGGGEAWLHRPSPTDPPGHSTPFVEQLAAPRGDTLDGVLAAGGSGTFFVDLTGAPEPITAAAGTHNGPEVELADIGAAFDGILHVESLSPWHTWIDERGHWS
ncbi:erythromycin esterase [Microbacterium natoriense]|uniref:Erythromycin esterase n=1 Tax=Microbacterium natoriense TaxID=284570 RepID=A0AAW8EXS1_9MICO|nr:erythromycin esterase [Microbacterium natoriense]